jgi:hypothetical protein
MAKATGKKARTVTCGSCKEEGHNARTCPKKETPPPPVTTHIEARDAKKTTHTVPKRDAPTGDRGTAATAAPYRCNKCNQVAILVIVKVKDHDQSFKKGKEVFKGEMRCEQCMNKPTPSDLILIWGALPDQTVDNVDA